MRKSLKDKEDLILLARTSHRVITRIDFTLILNKPALSDYCEGCMRH